MKTGLLKPASPIVRAGKGFPIFRDLSIRQEKLLSPIGIFLFAVFVSLHLPDGIARANPVPFNPFDFLDPLRMDLSLINLGIAVPLAIIVEFTAVFFTLQLRSITSSMSVLKMFASVALINLITVPTAWFSLKIIFGVAPPSSAVPILLVELAVVGIEAFFYSKVFHLEAREAFWVAFVPNLTSYIIGLIAYGYAEPYHSPIDFGWD